MNYLRLFCFGIAFAVVAAQTIGSEFKRSTQQNLLEPGQRRQQGQQVSALQVGEIWESNFSSTVNRSNYAQEELYNTDESCQTYNHTGNSCDSCHDGIALFNTTAAGRIAYAPCPLVQDLPPLEGYASRQCYENGSWASIANYSTCITQLQLHMDEKERELKVLTNSVYVFTGGFLLSNSAMIVAMIIFTRYKHLRCLRNLIHSQLLLGMTIKNFLWMILMFESLQELSIFDQPVKCKIFFMVYKYFAVAQYAWMFVEGLYLFIVVVNALSTTLLRFKHCLLIGWGIPTVVIIASIILNSILSEDRCWNVGDLTPANSMEIVSISLLLVANIVFMAVVIHTLYRKLRKSRLNESRQYRKVVKATLILVPLLGGTYIMLYYSPPGVKATSAIWYYLNALVQSTQGFVVALVYCFLNAEVRTSIAKSHRRWKDEKTLPSSYWWSKKRRSSYFVTRSKDETTETDTTACQYSSANNSRRVSEDTLSGSRRGSLPSDIYINKFSRKVSPLTCQASVIVETHKSGCCDTEQTTLPLVTDTDSQAKAVLRE
ncbi:corticotropin-releasing factor receptor 1-like [Watersipora subatra]|uniref:corticotropin-releasing factor receptor 1-like n=1 Tax=Watersipora subatra TaxID=2589382 RepID=UPI00355B06B0